jgi:hypothetical protein
MAKTIAVVVSGAPESDALREATIEPGSTAGDVLAALNLTGYLLSRAGSAQHFAAEEVIYDAVRDGDKLNATPVATVGGNLLDLLVSLFSSDSNNQPLPRTGGRTVTVRRPNGTVGRGVLVTPDSRPLWQQRGWRRVGSRLVGAYRTPLGSFAGEVEMGYRPAFTIVNPPVGLLRGQHGQCFRPRGGGVYAIHWSRGHSNPDAGIAAVENLLLEALGGRR